MSTSDEIATLRAELAELRKQTDRLREEMDGLTRFIHVQRNKEGKPYMSITCWLMEFVHPEDPNRTQMFLSAGKGDDGPYISLWGKDSKARMILKLEDDEPKIQVLAPGLKHSVLITAPKDGRGIVGVFDNGNPRAVMKAGPDNAGVVSVVHDDGHSRATLHGSEEEGAVMVATMDMKTAVKLSSKSLHGGGTLTVNGMNGKPAVILSSLDPFGGCIILKDAEGNTFATLPDPDKLGDSAAEEE